jgi:hypothetical protein
MSTRVWCQWQDDVSTHLHLALLFPSTNVKSVIRCYSPSLDQDGGKIGVPLLRRLQTVSVGFVLAPKCFASLHVPTFRPLVLSL